MWIISKILKLFKKKDCDSNLEITYLGGGTLLVDEDLNILAYGKDEKEIEEKLAKEKENENEMSR